MPNFQVKVTSTEVYIFPSIEADNEEEAKDKALILLEDNGNKNKYHDDSEGSEEAWEI